MLCQINSEFPVAAYIEVGEGTNYPKASDIDFFTKKLLVVSAFTIDVNYTFINYDFRFLEGASINMRQGVHLTLNHSNLFSCEGMWQGIFLNNECSITTNNFTRIEDAMTAINSTNVANAHLNIEHTTFNRNHIGVILKKNLHNNGNSNNTIIDKLDHNIFSCTAPLNSGSSDITRSGIEADGEVLILDFNENVFESIEFGILGFNETFGKYSIVGGRNNKFLDIRNTGIKLDDGSVRLKGNDFYNCAINAICLDKGYESKIENRCTFVVDNNVENLENSVNGSLVHGVRIRRRLVNPCCFIIDNCIFIDRTTHTASSPDSEIFSVTGISIRTEELFTSELSITNNNFTMNSNSGTGIALFGSNSSTSKTNLIENVFRFGSSQGTTGNTGIKIQVGNKHNLRIIGNDFIGFTSSGSTNNIGMTLSGSEGLNNLIQGNTFNSGLFFNPTNKAYVPVISSGISVSNFSNTTFCENTNFRAFNLISFSGTNLGTIYTGNSSVLGTILNFSGGGVIITDQRDQGNEFAPWFDNGIAIAAANQAIASDPTTAILSVITVHTEQSEDYLDNWNVYHPLGISPDQNNEWWTNLGTNGSPSLLCTQQRPSAIGSLKLEEALVNNSLDQYFNDEREIWLNKRYAYFFAKNNEFGDSGKTELSVFLDRHDTDNIGKLYLVSKILSQIQGASNPNLLLEEAKQLNNSIVSTIEPEENEVILNRVIIDYYFNENVELDQSTVDQLISIASQNEKYGGLSVLKARSILPSCIEIEYEVSREEYSDANEIRAFSTTEYSFLKRENYLSVNLVEFFPNPVHDFLNINSSNAGKVDIFNSVGIKVYSSPFEKNSQLDLTKLNSGIYFCQVEFSNGEKKIKKIIVK